MQIEKLTRTFYNTKENTIEQAPVYRITYKSLMVMEEELTYAMKKMFMYAHYKKMLNLK